MPRFCASEYENCSTDKLTLLKALYKTKDNLYQLDRAFAPPGKGDRTSRYIRVHYSFANENEEFDDSCCVTYIWAIGGFLLIHSPEIFQYTSLYFSTPANDEYDVYLKLPFHCRGLINDTTSCSCYHVNVNSSEPLLVFTNQVKLIACSVLLYDNTDVFCYMTYGLCCMALHELVVICSF